MLAIDAVSPLCATVRSYEKIGPGNLVAPIRRQSRLEFRGLKTLIAAYAFYAASWLWSKLF